MLINLLGTSAVTVAPSGVPSAGAFGTAIFPLTVAPSGVPSAGAFGTPKLVHILVFPGISPGGLGTPSLGSLVTATPLLTGYSTSHRAQVAEYKHQGYINNGWDKLVRWDGRENIVQFAGISAPPTDTDSWVPVPGTAAGDTTLGLHIFRYRYLDSITGYVSNPSEERELIVALGNEKLTFNMALSGTPNIITSSDPKVDKIVVEMTPVNSTVFRKAAEAVNAAGPIDIDITDPFLEQQFLAWPEYGHDVPPVAKNIVSHRDRIWLFGQVVHSTGVVDVSSGSKDILAGAIDPDWRASALGDTTIGSPILKNVAWTFVVAGDSRAYEIDTYDQLNNKLILTEDYAGTTGTDLTYQIFSRANVVWVSEPGFPESFKPLAFLLGPSGEGAGDITAGVGYSSSMIFFSESGMFKLSWDEGPLIDPVQFPISNKYGALNQRVVIEVEGTVYAMDRRGWSSWRGVFPQFISRPIDTLRALIDYDLAETFHAVFMHELRAIRWYVVYKGDALPKNYIQLDIDSRTWSTGQYNHALSASRLTPSFRGLETLFGDSSGHLWMGDVGTADGCEPGVSHLLAAAGATTTVIPTTGANLPVAAAGLTGVFAFHLASGEARLITGNAIDELTVSPAFSTPPTPGDTIWLGVIPSKLKTKAFSARKMGEKLRTRYLWLQYRPTEDPRKLQLRVFENTSLTPKAWAATRSDPNPGVGWPGSDAEYPSTDWLLDMSEPDANMQIPVGSEFKRYLEFEFEINEPDAPIELLGLEYDAIDLEDEQ